MLLENPPVYAPTLGSVTPCSCGWSRIAQRVCRWSWSGHPLNSRYGCREKGKGLEVLAVLEVWGGSLSLSVPHRRLGQM